jgi:serine/threonine protein kinase
LIGKTLAHFTITAKLGEGGMGEVYLAEDTKLGREVAIKVLPEALAGDSERLARFQREAQAIAALNHPNIVTIYSVEQAVPRETDLGSGGHDPESEHDSGSVPQPSSSTVHFLTMELVEGESLDHLLPKGGLALSKVLDIGTQTAEALAIAHDKGIVHRDLKPSNIMVSPNGVVKLLDFGLAKLASDTSGIPTDAQATQAAPLTEDGMVMGTAPFMSPEQAQGQSVDSRTDIFSLGSVLYESATGTRPFHGDSTIDTLHKIIHAEPEPLEDRIPQAPLQLQWILRKALAKSPDERYQNARDLAIDLKTLRRDLNSDTSVVTVMSGQVQPLEPPAQKRSPVLLATAAVVVLTAVAALFWFLGQRATGPSATVGAPVARQVQPITNSGDVISAAISPDGKYIAYEQSARSEQTLYLRQLDGTQSLQLVPPQGISYWGLTFNPEGTAVVFGVKSDNEPTGALMQISTLGGRTRKLATTLDSTPAFSPDGSQLAWLAARVPEERHSSIMIAKADGRDPRILATFEVPERIVPIFHAGPSWSPDGRLIATSAIVTGDETKAKVVAVDTETGSVAWIAEPDWSYAAAVGWLPDGSGLLVVAEHVDQEWSQIWHLSYPEGEARQITSDLFEYRTISLTADGDQLVTIPTVSTSDIWSLSLTTDQPSKKISQSRQDGFRGFAFAPDGRILYQTQEAGRIDLAFMNADGSERQRLTDDYEVYRYPTFAPDGSIVYWTNPPTGPELRRMDSDGTNPRFLATADYWAKPDISPDGSWVYYSKFTDGISQIWRVPIDSGTPERVTEQESFFPAISPDGSRLAFYFVDPEDDLSYLGVRPIAGGELLVRLKARYPYSGSWVRWTDDGQALVINTMPGDRANLWRLPLDGSEPERLTNFGELRLYWWEFSPDGESLVVTRGDLSRDAVLMRNFL